MGLHKKVGLAKMQVPRPSPGASRESQGLGPGGSTLAPCTLAVITTRAGHCQDHPMDGNRGPDGIGLGLLLGGFPSHSWGLGEGGGGPIQTSSSPWEKQ